MIRRGDWIQTYTGKAFYPLDPLPSEVCLYDIAHALSHLCRYGGHVRRFYSVAEHSVLMAAWFLRQGERDLAKWALMHDAAEAYLVDVPRPIKAALPEYRNIEAAIMRAVCSRFGLPVEEPPQVKEADTRILTDEARALMAPPPMPWATDREPLGVVISNWRPVVASCEFYNMAVELFGEGPNRA